MKASLGPLKRLLQSNVCEVRTLRRLPIANRATFRRCLCTNSLELLLSNEGRMTLNFMPARGILPYNPTQKRLIVVWDILMQNFRQLNMNACDLVNTIPIKDFWKYFNEKIVNLTAQQKMAFMDN
jgi:hypothetical protein